MASAFHPHNRFSGPHDLIALVARTPSLQPHVRENSEGDLQVDFRSSDAVRAFNRALLEGAYGLQQWTFPEAHLCPAIPGRMEYLVRAQEAMMEGAAGRVPRLTLLDVGTGASGVYAVLAAAEWGWKVWASDVSRSALSALGQILSANPQLRIVLRHQPDPSSCFEHAIPPHELVDLSVCNPPFYNSEDEARRQRQRRWKGPAVENFTGTPSELICPQGEHGFLHRMVKESQTWGHRILWFSTLVSQGRHVNGLLQSLKKLGATAHHQLPIQTSGKSVRVLMWTFKSPSERDEWRRMRWD